MIDGILKEINPLKDHADVIHQITEGHFPHILAANQQDVYKRQVWGLQSLINQGFFRS